MKASSSSIGQEIAQAARKAADAPPAMCAAPVASKALAIALLAAGLVTSWGASQANASFAVTGTQVAYSIDPTANLTNGYFFLFNANGSPTSFVVANNEFQGDLSLTANTTTSGTVIFPDISPFAASNVGFLGVYNTGTIANPVEGVSALFATNNFLGSDFNTVFGLTESTVLSDLTTANLSDLANQINSTAGDLASTPVLGSSYFLGDSLTAPISGYLINFSGGSNGGTLSGVVTVAPSPEAPAFSLAAAALLGVAAWGGLKRKARRETAS